MSFAVVIPTLDAGSLWYRFIEAIKSQTLVPDKVLVVDSGSSDGTIHAAIDAGFDVYEINKKEFNHGGTRQKAVDVNLGYDYIVFLTQDAILSNDQAFSQLISEFDDLEVAAVCGRQLPAHNSSAIAAHARLFNYPETSLVHSIKDAGKKGLKVAFLSNSFAAYRVSALLDIGGFPKDVIYGEDMYAAAKMLKQGWKIAYTADACVYHSHNYTLWHEFRRYFDLGVFHTREPWLRQELGSAEKEGKKFVISEMKYLLKNAFWGISEGLFRTVLRYLGFRLGLLEKRLPDMIKMKLSMNSGFFSQKT